jgi:hypothetical protein
LGILSGKLGSYKYLRKRSEKLIIGVAVLGNISFSILSNLGYQKNKRSGKNYYHQ